MAEAFGLIHVIVSTDRPRDPNTSRFLENTATTRGKPSITAEAGRSGPVDASDVAVLVRGVRNVMAHLKMTAQSASPGQRTLWIEKLVTVTADEGGMFHPAVDRDREVTAGTKIGVVTDYLNRPLQEIVAPEAGLILFVRALPSLRKGDTIASIGVIKKSGQGR
jgi:predicted deacylase